MDVVTLMDKVADPVDCNRAARVDQKTNSHRGGLFERAGALAAAWIADASWLAHTSGVQPEMISLEARPIASRLSSDSVAIESINLPSCPLSAGSKRKPLRASCTRSAAHPHRLDTITGTPHA